MASKAGAVPSPRTHETAYRQRLWAYISASWKRITNDPFADIEDLFTELAIPAVDTMIQTVNLYNMRKLVAGLEKVGSLPQNRALGADITFALTQARRWNVDLIRDVTQQQRDFAREEIAKIDADMPLEKRLVERLGVSKSRAKLIARDQVSKLNATLSEERHKAAGSERYEWSTSGDERVRSRHVEIDGNIYRYGEPTDAEDGLGPGQPIGCRCVGIAIFD